MYNGRDGVVTDDNGLIYMRARYYSPELRRFVNADIIAGKITNAITLNRYAYANGNPVSFVDPLGLWSLKNAWNKLTDWVEEKIVDPVVETCRQVKDTIVNSVVNTYKETKDTVVETCNNVKKSVTSAYNEVKKQAVDTYDNITDKTSQVIEGAKDMTEKVVNKANEVIDTGVSIATKVKTISSDVSHIIASNITGSAGICIGMGMANDNIEAVVRMDIIGVQIKDESVRIGHPGRSAFNVTVPIASPYADITLGRQNNTFEDFEVKKREVEDPVYFDIGKSYNRAAAFVIGYHYDISISYLGICQDLYQYFS